MNPELLEKAKAKVPSVPLLINMVSRRVRQLNSGFKPYVRRLTRDEEHVDIAMREIAEGKFVAEIGVVEEEILPQKPILPEEDPTA